jgi:hypothetical protein
MVSESHTIGALKNVLPMNNCGMDIKIDANRGPAHSLQNSWSIG